ncbi:uncharacterized protein LOC118280517 [Spodoptera frugiperda]|uniref:Uncharacterized protein LOC118280517 n=1 Tax=Spodoptera frugiperda TaxID=7108 RepID=A0A9R0E4E3_SPOFR|nr:uncharacterized protein LOC118280517 [Spodoptera frugiperda]
MFSKIIIILVCFKNSGLCDYLESEANYLKPKLDRNNIVNKGVWVRNKAKENLFEKSPLGDFIFRENSLDVDNLLQNNFDAFGTNYMQDSPFVSAYVKRNKREVRRIREQRPRKSIIKNCIGKGCKMSLDAQDQGSDLIKTKVNELRTTSVFNDYPYEVAILPNNNTENVKKDIPKNANYNYTRSYGIPHTESFAFESDNDTAAVRNISSPKRSMKYDFETEIIKKFEFTEDINKTHANNEFNDSKITDRNIFDKESVWHQNAPIPDVNVYKVVPKEPQKSKPVTERGLIKVISMLTKTFKKIMKQHNEIKDIHSRINDINEEFIKNAATVTGKFQDFDLKYLYLLKFHEKLKVFDAKLASKQEYFKNKEREMARNFKEFENQQKKFLQQQRQFYNIQKLMLAQNEKINLKQNLIAKTQSEISHRQNNFARILKKAKQLYVESRNPTITKLSSSLTKVSSHNHKSEPVTHTSTVTPSTESVKINLFSIPTSNKLENQDDLIMKEKDDQTIDDLVYKYYFNNTFIDNLMKNNILANVMGAPDSATHQRNVKSKRNELETTILLPVYETNDSETYSHKNRERRWINHHSRHRGKRRYRGKNAEASIVNATDAKILRNNVVNNVPLAADAPVQKETKDIKIENDPFLIMATNFCNEIRQNLNPQMLRWCVEKALRRLQFLDIKTPPPLSTPPLSTTTPEPPITIPTVTKLNELVTSYAKLAIPAKPAKRAKPANARDADASTTVNVVTEPSSVSTVEEPIEATVSPSTTLASENITTAAINETVNNQTTLDVNHFPDNEELESNLKQYEMKPDLEGNVYYEGSIHASEIMDSESQGIDDIMPGLDSNSRVDIDPLAFDLQAQRRAFVRRLNEKIKMSLG